MTSTALTLDSLSPGRDLDAYMATVGAIPVLTREEEQDLARRFLGEDDLDAARHLVLAHLRFVVHVARTYTGYGLPQGDLIQEGNVGLMKAVKRFDPDRGVRLVSFAVHWIRAEMHEFILRNWRIVKVATTKAQRKLFFNLRSSKKKLGWLNEAEAEAMAKDLGVDASVVTQMEGRMNARDLSFDPAPGSEDNDDFAAAPAQFLEDSSHNPEAEVEADNWEANSLAGLRGALAMLDERSRDIVQCRWLAEEKMTLTALGERYGVSAERIRQLEKNAMKKLKVSMQEVA